MLNLKKFLVSFFWKSFNSIFRFFLKSPVCFFKQIGYKTWNPFQCDYIFRPIKTGNIFYICCQFVSWIFPHPVDTINEQNQLWLIEVMSLPARDQPTSSGHFFPWHSGGKGETLSSQDDTFYFLSIIFFPRQKMTWNCSFRFVFSFNERHKKLFSLNFSLAIQFLINALISEQFSKCAKPVRKLVSFHFTADFLIGFEESHSWLPENERMAKGMERKAKSLRKFSGICIKHSLASHW